MCVDKLGNVIVVGGTASINFPTSADACVLVALKLVLPDYVMYLLQNTVLPGNFYGQLTSGAKITIGHML